MNNLSLEQLENDFWGEPVFDSYVVKTAHIARKKPLSQLTMEEIRLLIGQKIGLKYLIPIAVRELEKNPLLETAFYEGDLLAQLLSLDRYDWADNLPELKKLTAIVNENKKAIADADGISQALIDGFEMYTK